MKARELADELGIDVNDILDEWDYRAGVRQYDGKTILDVANREAFKEIEAWFRQQCAKEHAA